MLPKTKRITTSVFKEIVARGTSFHSKSLTFKVIRTKTATPSRFSVAVSKKVAKKAVERNKIRRRVYAAVAHVYPKVNEGYLGVFFAQDMSKKNKPKDFITDIEFLLVKSGCLVQ